MMRQLREIKSVGVEIEGGYCTECINPLIDQYRDQLHIDIDDDGSVDVYGHCSKHESSGTSDYDWKRDAEIQAWVNVEDLPILMEFVDKLFKTKVGRNKAFRQNSSCGNHIHIRFIKSDTWKKFCLRDTWEEFRMSYCNLFKTSKYLGRLHNSYCSSTWENDIASGHCYNRYKMINVDSMSDAQQTLEFRILPHFGRINEPVPAYEKMLGLIDRIASQEIMC